MKTTSASAASEAIDTKSSSPAPSGMRVKTRIQAGARKSCGQCNEPVLPMPLTLEP
jgi:hypothetical protein